MNDRRPAAPAVPHPDYKRDEQGRILLSSFLEAQEVVYFDGDATWSLHCQGHGDAHPSLDITYIRAADSEPGRILMNCWSAACTKQDVLDAYYLSLRDIATMHADEDAWNIDTHGSVPGKARRGKQRSGAAYRPIAGMEQAQLIGKLGYMTKCLMGNVAINGTFPEEALQYIHRRWGLSAGAAQRLGLGLTSISAFKNGDEHSAGVSVPFRGVVKNSAGDYELGDEMGYQVRNVHPGKLRWDGPANPNDGSHGWTRTGWFNLFNEAFRTDVPVIITEGPGDALTASSIGAAAVAVRGSKNAQNSEVQDEVVAMVRLLAEERKMPVAALIAKDGDAAGEGFAEPLAKALHAAGIPVSVMNTPAGADLTSLREADASLTIDAVLAMSSAWDPNSTMKNRLQASDSSKTPRGSVGGLSAFGELQLDVHGYKNTDLSSAYMVQATLEQLGGQARYNADIDKWMTYDMTTGLWKMDTLNRLQAALRRLASYLDDASRRDARAAAACEEGSIEQRKAEFRAKHSSAMSFRFETATKVESTIKMLKGILIVENADFDREENRDLIVVGNGVVDARTLELRPHDPELMATRGTPVHWIPDARSAKWEEFIHQVSEADPVNMPAYLQDLFGMVIIGRMRDHFWHLYGKGGAGKGTLVRNIGAATGNYITELKGTDLEAGFASGRPSMELLDTMGARGILIDEVSERCLIDDAMLKSMTGRGLMMARPMYGRDIIRFRLQGSMLCIANNYLRYKTVVYGTDLTRRVIVVPFTMQLTSEQRTSDLDDLLNTPSGLEAILAWTITGANRTYSRKTWDKDPFVERATDAMWAELNPLSDLLGAPGSPLEATKDHVNDRIPRPDTYALYSQWMHSRGVEVRMSSTAFYKHLENGGAKVLKSNGQVYLTGIRVTEAGAKFPAGKQSLG